jgi:hypothetical protein
LIVALGCASHSPTAPLIASIPTNYHVSGVVTDDAGSPVPNVPLALGYATAFQRLTTSTDAQGAYDFDFATAADGYDGIGGYVGALFYTGSGDFENSVQSVPWGTADVVKNLRLRRVRTVDAGQSFNISIDPDSSAAYDGDDWVLMAWRWEKVHVRVAEAGVLTIGARAPAGTIVQSLGVACLQVADNCQYSWAKTPPGSGPWSLNVRANSLFEITLAIPSPLERQRYEISTSLVSNAVPTLLER